MEHWNRLEASFKGTRCTIWLFVANIAMHDDIACLQCAQHAIISQKWTAVMDLWVTWAQLQLSPTKNLPLSLSGRKGSFEGHWSGSYCPGGRQIGPVKPHCQSDWNWFVVLLLHHPIKRRNLSERRKGEKMRENESKRSIAWPWRINGAAEARRKRGLFSAVAPQRAARVDMGEQSRHTAIPTHCCNGG